MVSKTCLRILAGAFPWAPQGLELAFAQLELPVKRQAPVAIRTRDLPPLRMQETNDAVILDCPEQRLVFSRLRGTLAAWESNGMPLLVAGPRFNAWRAPTDNDVHVANEWRRVGLDRLEQRIAAFDVQRLSPQSAQIKINTVHAGKALAPVFNVDFTYTLFASGDLFIDTLIHYTGRFDKFPHLPRLGLTLKLPREFDRFHWFGRGPHEAYSDRKESTFVGRFSGSVAEQYVPYIKPQENGNKIDVRWASLTTARGAGLIGLAPTGGPLFNASTHHFTAADFTAAKHTYDLHERPVTVFNLDYAHGGLGSNSCGPGPLEQYQLKATDVNFRIRLKAISLESTCPFALCSEIFEEAVSPSPRRSR